jgi:hypothetical protein
MFPFKVTVSIEGIHHEVDVRQMDPLHAHYEIFSGSSELGKLHKVNDRWFADEGSCLLPADVTAIGEAIDSRLADKNLRVPPNTPL